VWEVALDLKNPDTGDKGKIAVVRQINRTIRDQRCGKMDGIQGLGIVRRAQLSSGAEDSAGYLLEAKIAPTCPLPGQKPRSSYVPAGSEFRVFRLLCVLKNM